MVVVNRFPVCIFGQSDVSGQFFPMACAIMSHECIEDFERFFRTFVELCEKMGLDFDPKFIMQDACDASYRAIQRVFNKDEKKVTNEKIKKIFSCIFERKDAVRLNTFINIYRIFYSLTAVQDAMMNNTLLDTSTQLKPVNVYQNLQNQLIIEQHNRLEAAVATNASSLFFAAPAPVPLSLTVSETPKTGSGRRAKTEPANYTTKTKRTYNKKK
jgi:hypothetical protein